MCIPRVLQAVLAHGSCAGHRLSVTASPARAAEGLQHSPRPCSSPVPSWLFLTHFLHCRIRAKRNGAGGREAAGLAWPLARCAGEGTVIGQGKAAGRRVAGARKGSGSEELGLCGFPLPAALCRTCSGGCRTALQAGARQQPRSEGWCLGRESIGAEPKESTGGYREQDRDQAPKFTTSSPSLVPTFLPPHHPPRPSPRCPVGRGSFRGTSKG